MAETIDSNITGLAIAEETSLKVLPGSPVFYTQEPNSYSDIGGEITNVMRAPIDPSRQRKKGTVVDLDASGGFNVDLTQNNLTRLLQGFFWADAREKVRTNPLNGTAIPLTALTTSSYDAASGLDSFIVGSLILASKMNDSANNGLAYVSAVTATAVTVDKTLVVDAAPAADSFIETVGFEFPASDIDIVASATSITLTSTLTDFTTLDLNIGEWVFIGGDATINKFANNVPGYARVKSIAANVLSLDETTFAATSETGTALELQMFFGTVVRNEKDTALIKRRSYNIERTLGSDDDGVQSEYLEGAIANEFTLNIPSVDKINADLTFVAMDSSQRTGLVGVKSGTRVPAPCEDPFNTSSDIYRIKLSIVDPLTLNPTALFGYVTEATLPINNNVTANKAIATLGAFEATAGDFEVGGSITAYFSKVEAVAAVRNNSDVALSIIAAQNNGAVVLDMPLIALGGGRLTVEKDAPIMIPLDTNAAECPAGYTLLSSFLSYVPNVGMPS